ncbi:sugar transferase [Microbacterium sp. ZW T5_45]|uniref:sugar transferase n=1 Tax=Microbacterium sp. ZW T5_45 TaxID=3378080 RepID=UPI003853666D
MTALGGAIEAIRARPVFTGSDRHRAEAESRAAQPHAVSPRASAALERRRLWERRYRMRLQLTDAVVIMLAVGLTAVIERFTGQTGVEPIRDGLLLAVVWFTALSAVNSRAQAILGSGATEYRRVANAGALAFGATAIAAVLLEWQGLQPLFFIALPVGMLGLLYSRWLWRRWLQRQRLSGRYASRTLVVGDAEDVEYVIGALQKGGENGYNVVGTTLFDHAVGTLTIGECTYPVVGDIQSVAVGAADLGADAIIVASRPEGDPDFVKHLSWELEGTAAELILSSRLTDVAGPRVSLRQVDGLPLIQVKIPTYEGGLHVLKRALDILVAVAALIPIAVLTPALALLVKIDSPGPVFFFQERVGRDGRRFRMVKFRSMRTDAEQQLAALKAQNEGAGLLFKMKDDPRVTRVGRVLRKLSLDELPQFWNVLVGDMSVVGPRPPLPSEVTAYDGTIYRRLYIKPGITGLWQVSGRSDLSWEESVRLDLRYVENWSVMNDLQIMWRTAKVMVRPSGAY